MIKQQLEASSVWVTKFTFISPFCPCSLKITLLIPLIFRILQKIFFIPILWKGRHNLQEPQYIMNTKTDLARSSLHSNTTTAFTKLKIKNSILHLQGSKPKLKTLARPLFRKTILILGFNTNEQKKIFIN